MWKSNKYFNYLCIGLIIFIQIISGFLEQVKLLPHLNKEHEHLNNLHKTILHVSILLNLTAIISGFLLLFGVILRQPKLTLCHMIMTVVCSAAVIIFLVVVVCLKRLKTDLVIDGLLVTAAVYVFVCCLEYAVYLFYREIISVKEEDVTELVVNEWFN